jgi:hypothetical protein
MKKLFLMTGFLAVSALVFAKTTDMNAAAATVPPPLPPYHHIISVTANRLDPCHTMITIHLESTWAFNAHVSVTMQPWPNFVVQPLTIPMPDFLMPADEYTYSFVVAPPVAVFYNVTVTDVDNGYDATGHVAASTRKCTSPNTRFESQITPGDDTDWVGRFIPENPNEDPNLEVKWRIDEINAATKTIVHSIENTVCWNSANMPGADCSFKGFNGFNTEESIAELQAGNCSNSEGVFDESKLYLITRSVRLPGNDWDSYSMFFGPGADSDEPQERGRLSESTPSVLFTLAQDRLAKTVTFLTETSNGRFEILDASGKHIAAIDLSDETYAYTLDVAAFAKGLYVVRLVSGSQAGTEKFVVE